MSYDLPKATQTQRLNSLPDDLKKIAQELIAKKFGVPEVIQRKASTPSQSRSGQTRQEDTGYGARYGSISSASNVASERYRNQGNREIGIDPGSDFSIRENQQAHSYIVSISDVSERTLLTVLHMMDMNNFRRRKSVLHISNRDSDMLRMNPAFSYYSDMQMGRIYEFEVLPERNSNQSYIQFFY